LEGLLSFSIGLIKATHKSDLIRKADMLLYRVKKEGKDGYLYEVEKV
jgi:GGDEF domain-containing protein